MKEECGKCRHWDSKGGYEGHCRNPTAHPALQYVHDWCSKYSAKTKNFKPQEEV